MLCLGSSALQPCVTLEFPLSAQAEGSLHELYLRASFAALKALKSVLSEGRLIISVVIRLSHSPNMPAVQIPWCAIITDLDPCSSRGTIPRTCKLDPVYV